MVREDHCLLEGRFSAVILAARLFLLVVLLEWKRTALAVLFLLGELGG